MALYLTKPVAIKHSTRVNLKRNQQTITRFQSLCISKTFPLLELPAELRIMIYKLCFTLTGIETWFDKFWDILRKSRWPEKESPPCLYMTTPTVLLICKQVYTEATPLLEKESLCFHHGLLDLTGLHNVMRTSVLRNISHLTIDGKGHEMLPKDPALVGPSWRGHLDLVVEVSHLLGGGHKLKSFTLDFTDKTVHDHVTDCCHKPFRCDFRDQLIEALASLRMVRGVRTVNLAGIPAAMIPDLKARMESTPPTFFSFPGELRNAIYTYCADWSDISVQLSRTMKAWKDKTQDPPYPRRSTPTVFLLNKQIYAEAKSTLHAKPLDLTLPQHHGLRKQSQALNTLKFIRPLTLAKVQHLHIRVESWEWVYSLDRFLPNLAKHHRLRTFKITFKDALKRTFLAQGKAYPDASLHMSLGALAKVRGVGLVVFEGDLPKVYTAPLRMIMESPEVDGEVLPVMRALTEGGEVVEVEADVED